VDGGRAKGTAEFIHSSLLALEVPMKQLIGLTALVAFLGVGALSTPGLAGEDKKEEKKGGNVIVFGDEEKKKEDKKGGNVIVFGDEEKKDEKKGGK
jgi:hypothetical protein